eukprot:scaffold60849_cov23-Prasinocladus_malaysianus.AAC.1
MEHPTFACIVIVVSTLVSSHRFHAAAGLVLWRGALPVSSFARGIQSALSPCGKEPRLYIVLIAVSSACTLNRKPRLRVMI